LVLGNQDLTIELGKNLFDAEKSLMNMFKKIIERWSIKRAFQVR
jgi:hypothetical protein